MEHLYPRETVLEALYAEGDINAYRRLIELLTPSLIDYNTLYRSALSNGHCDVADQLEAMPTAYVELSNDEIMEYALMPHDCTLAHILRVYRSFDGYFSEFFFADGAASTNDLDLFLRLLRLYDVSDLMYHAASYGGLSFLERLALHGYYLTLVQAASFGLPYVYLALEDYDDEPSQDEVVDALEAAVDQESYDLLTSLLPDGIDFPNYSCSEA